MGVLTPQQRDRAVQVMKEYLAAPPNPDGRTPRTVQGERDESRAEHIDGELKPLVQGYLASRIPLAEFKPQIDGLNKRYEYWGFKGIKGQMFFNMLLNTAGDEGECDRELKKSLTLPPSEGAAKEIINGFASYATRLGDRHVKEGGTKHGRPKVGSVPFFLSYFWQLQDRITWPVYYTNTVNVLGDLNLWHPGEDLGENYLQYKHIHEELGRVFTEVSGYPFGLYEVEHVFWFKGGNPYGGNLPLAKDHGKQTRPSAPEPMGAGAALPDGYVPPIVSALLSMAKNEPAMQEAAKRSGISLERAFEKSVDAAFTVLGYETQLLGQGQGRVPDGQATSPDDFYAILWDAKVREKPYSMGTDDRAIREYVTTRSRELRKNRSLRNIYYVLVSSSFADDFDDSVRSIKMETEVNDVVLLEAEALVAIVDARLRSPREVTLGPDGIQRLWSSSGILTAADVKELLG